MKSDNSKSQIDFRSQNNKNLNLSFTVFEIQFKIQDLRLYYWTAHLLLSDVIYAIPSKNFKIQLLY